MTEYDFSPAAYERHLKNQNRVSNWVSSQSSHTKSYSNPFVPSAYHPPQPLPPDDTRPSARASSRSRSSTVTSIATPSRQTPVRSHTTHDALGRPEPERRHTPTRSRTLPPNAIIAPQPTYPVIPNPSQAILVPNPSHDHHHRSSRRSSTKSPTRSHYRHHQSSNSRSHSIPVHGDRDPSGRTVIQLERDSRNKVLQLPPPRLGEQYVIIPPPGGKVELMSPQNYPADGKDRERETTFLKRLFGGLTKGGGGGGGRSPSSRSRSGSGHRRRRSY